MTESFRHEDTSSGRVQLEDGRVEVFFDGDGSDKAGSIILDTADVVRVIERRPFAVIEYEELVLPNNEIVVPADISPDLQIAQFSGAIEPVVRAGATSILRTIQYRQEMKFLDIVKNDTTIAERNDIRESLLKKEKERVPAVIRQQQALADSDENLELWVRLEACNNPDKNLVGKIIMARLAFFISHDTEIGVTPMIYSATDGMTTRIPEQIGFHETWLYTKVV